MTSPRARRIRKPIARVIVHDPAATKNPRPVCNVCKAALVAGDRLVQQMVYGNVSLSHQRCWEPCEVDQ